VSRHKKQGVGSIDLSFKGELNNLFNPELLFLGEDFILSTECTKRTIVRAGREIQPDLGMAFPLEAIRLTTLAAFIINPAPEGLWGMLRR
jgi:hypothetical protein